MRCWTPSSTQDPEAQVACETLVKTGFVLVAGEITTSAWVDLEPLVRGVVNDIGYNHSDLGFDGNACARAECHRQAVGATSPRAWTARTRASRAPATRA